MFLTESAILNRMLPIIIYEIDNIISFILSHFTGNFIFNLIEKISLLK